MPALYLLPGPSVPEAARVAAVDHADAGAMSRRRISAAAFIMPACMPIQRCDLKKCNDLDQWQLARQSKY